MVEGWVMEEIQNGKTLMSLLFPNNFPFIMIFSLFLTSFHTTLTILTWHIYHFDIGNLFLDEDEHFEYVGNPKPPEL